MLMNQYLGKRQHLWYPMVCLQAYAGSHNRHKVCSIQNIVSTWDVTSFDQRTQDRPRGNWLRWIGSRHYRGGRLWLSFIFSDTCKKRSWILRQGASESVVDLFALCTLMQCWLTALQPILLYGWRSEKSIAELNAIHDCISQPDALPPDQLLDLNELFFSLRTIFSPTRPL